MRFFPHALKTGRQAGMLAFLFILLIMFIRPMEGVGQISAGGEPASFFYRQSGQIPEITLEAPDLSLLMAEDRLNGKNGLAMRAGVGLSLRADLLKQGLQEELPDGSRIWRLKITAEGANAIGLYFSEFNLPPGYQLFAYDPTYQYLLGAYTLSNNSTNKLFAIELIPGPSVILELNAKPGATDQAICRLAEVSHLYRELPMQVFTRGVSDDCEVNVNCPEGANWQYQKQSVVRIYVKHGGGYYWCTGSLMNNTLQNNAPYLLTADHCAPEGSPDDLSQWVFYFNYEAPACENPAQNPEPGTLTGARRLANANTSGSDFLLLKLFDDVPESYEPYYNGWSIENVSSPNGVTIHHPAGDIKKISTYLQPLESSQWFSTPGTHWEVVWAETETNWGVTEGGSSGAPLYDLNGRVIGALTGGQAACEADGSGGGTGPDQPDYYGKFSYSWDQNGLDSTKQLKYWLDPINLGVTTLAGKNASLTASFQASTTILLAGGEINYTNLSSGFPVLWEWTFEGGEPAFFSGQHPGPVKYPNCGVFDVKLMVSDGFENDTLHLRDFIHVVGKVFPNPTNGLVNIYIEEPLPATIKSEVFNIYGQKMKEENFEAENYPLIFTDLSMLSSGIYTIRLTIKQRYVFARVMLIHP